MHVGGSGKRENSTETTGVRNGTKSVIVIAFAVSVASVHMLALNHKADFALVKFAIESLDFIVETSAEDLVLSCQSRA